MQEAIAFGLMWGAVLGAPVIAFLAFPGIRRSWPSAQAPIIIAAAIILCFAFCLVALGLSFTNVWANLALAVIAYFAYCFLAASSWQIPRRTIRYIAAFVTLLPICAGYVLGTVGALALAWIVSDYVSPPYQVERIGPELVCEKSGWGTIFSGGYKVQLYRFPFPFIEKQVVTLKVDQNASDPDKTCSDALDAYRHQYAN